jgi:hypothetical protein
MAHSYEEGAVPHHSDSHSYPIEANEGCPEFTADSAVTMEISSPDLLPSVFLGFLIQYLDAPVFLPGFFSISPAFNPPLLFLLLSTLRN